MTRRVAIVTPAIYEGGGTATVARFLYQTLVESVGYEPIMVSLATSARDQASLRLVAPSTWKRGVQVLEGRWNGIDYWHVGSWFCEVELFRYKSRKTLDEILRGIDLVQVVAGSPAWAAAVSKCDSRKALQVATLVKAERRSRIKAQRRGLRKAWLVLMTSFTHSIEKSVLKSLDVVFVENPWMQDWVKQLGGNGVLAPPGVNADIFSPSPHVVENGHILSVGRFADPRKNVRMLFETYKEVCDAYPKAPRLVLVGQSPTERDMAYAYSLGLGNRIEVRVGLAQDELVKAYREACLFVLSSDEEGLGLVLLEAMSSGVPVVSTRSKGAEWIVKEGETGILVDVGDRHGLALGVLHLVGNATLRREFGVKAREVVLQQFSQEACGRRFVEAYDQLFDGTAVERPQVTTPHEGRSHRTDVLP